MTDIGPTTLLTPPPIQEVPVSGMGPVVVGIALGVLLLLIVGALAHRRQRRLHPDERAFRCLCKRMGFTRSQIGLIRRHARARGLDTPVAVVLSEAILSEALARQG